MAGITTHVLDNLDGRPGAGMRIDFSSFADGRWTLVKSVITNVDGSVTVSPTEELTKILGPQVTVEDARYEMWGPAGVTITQQASEEDAPEVPS